MFNPYMLLHSIRQSINVCHLCFRAQGGGLGSALSALSGQSVGSSLALTLPSPAHLSRAGGVLADGGCFVEVQVGAADGRGLSWCVLFRLLYVDVLFLLLHVVACVIVLDLFECAMQWQSVTYGAYDQCFAAHNRFNDFASLIHALIRLKFHQLQSC